MFLLTFPMANLVNCMMPRNLLLDKDDTDTLMHAFIMSQKREEQSTLVLHCLKPPL